MNILLYNETPPQYYMHTAFNCGVMWFELISPSLKNDSLLSFISYRSSYKKIHTASLSTARWADLSTRHPSRLPNDAVCI